MRTSFILSAHARGRRWQRPFTDEEIDRALNEPVLTPPGNVSGRKSYTGPRNSAGRQLVVIATDPPDAQGRVTVITAYFRD